MPRRIQGPDGKLHEFPDDFTDADISSALDSLLPPSAPSGPEGSALSRFGSNLWDVVNPINAVKGLYEAATSPIETGKAIYGAQKNQMDKARQMFSEGRYSEMLGHGAAALVPLAGPIAADAGEQIGSGDVAGGLGKATGIIAPFGGAKILAKLGAKATPVAVANKLDEMAASRVADVMSPKSSAAKGLRMTAKAEKIAPKLAADNNAAWSRAGLKDAFTEKLTAAKAGMDEAADARNGASPIETGEILAALKEKRAKLTAQPFDASRPDVRALDKSGVPVGEAQIPAPNRARVAVLDKAIAEVEALGPIAPYESLRTIRAAYDGPAEVRYNPAVTPDFLANQSNAMASADVAGAIRDTLAKSDPTQAAANAQFSLYKAATDIVTAAEELEKARPKTGRRLMSQLTGSMIGGQAGGTAGAITGFALGPMVDSLMSAGVTTQLQTARLMTEMAKAIRGGNQTKVVQMQFKLRELAKQGAKAEVIRGTVAQAGQPPGQ